MCLDADLPLDFYSAFTNTPKEFSDRFWRQHLITVKGMSREKYVFCILVIVLQDRWWQNSSFLVYTIKFLIWQMELRTTVTKTETALYLRGKSYVGYLDTSQYVCSSASCFLEKSFQNEVETWIVMYASFMCLQLFK